MIKRIGYACINTSLKPKSFRSCRLKSVYSKGINYLREIIIHNLKLIKDIILWNLEKDIYMYRITSQVFPLVTHPDILRDFSFRWEEDYEILNIMQSIKEIALNNKIRLTMHPDQFTVLNSLNENVVKNSIKNIKYHYEVLKRLGGRDMIIHTGGVYGDKNSAIERFIKVYKNLSNEYKAYLRLENDDTSFTINDVLEISKNTDIPIVMDIHHHRCNNDGNTKIENIIDEVFKSWLELNRIPKIHISSGSLHVLDKKHADYITGEDYKYVLSLSRKYDFDVMVEAKMKEKAVLRLIE